VAAWPPDHSLSPSGPRERRGFAGEQGDGGVASEMRGASAECVGIAGQQHSGEIEPEPAIGPQEALGDPRAHEAGAAGDEDPRAASAGPQRLGVLEDVVQVAREWVVHGAYNAAGASLGMACMVSSMYSSMAGVMPGKTPTQNTWFITKSVLVSGVATRCGAFW